MKVKELIEKLAEFPDSKQISMYRIVFKDEIEELEMQYRKLMRGKKGKRLTTES